MVPPAVVLAARGSWRATGRDGAVLTLALPLVASLGVMALFHLKWFGSASPFAMRHGETGLIDPERLLNGIPGTILDQQYGLLWWAPLLMLAPFGALLRMWKRAPPSAPGRGLLAAALGPGLARQWYGGWSPAARFLVPLSVPLWLWTAARWMPFVQRPGAAPCLVPLLALQWAWAPSPPCPTKLFGTSREHPEELLPGTAGRIIGLPLASWLPLLRGPVPPLETVAAGLSSPRGSCAPTPPRGPSPPGEKISGAAAPPRPETGPRSDEPARPA